MNYQETLEYLFCLLPMYQRNGEQAIKPGLENIIALDTALGQAHHKFKSIHVAGTNGKGSVSHMLAAVFQQAGYKTGLYTSPHLNDYRERIRVNGQMIDQDFVVQFVKRIKNVIEQIEPSFFEITVAMAFDYFVHQKVDIAIIETGMGGRLDSTNIISPILSVITNIGFDHMQFLGDTLDEIAAEKAGIIKKGIPVVIGESHPETVPVFNEKARACNSSICYADKVFSADYSLMPFAGKQCLHVSKQAKLVYPDLEIDLQGMYQRKNVLSVLSAIEIVQEQFFSIRKNDIYAGLSGIKERTGFNGRWQIISDNPLIVADTGHNLQGLLEVMKQIKATPHKQLHVVFGVVNDKSPEKMLKLFPKDAYFYFTQADIPRAMPAETLSHKAKETGITGQHFANVKTAVQAAKNKAGKQDLIFVGGSTFIVAGIV